MSSSVSPRISQGTPAGTVKNAMRERERQLRELEKKLRDVKPNNAAIDMEVLPSLSMA